MSKKGNKKQYSTRQKLAYYSNRINDPKLTAGQRSFAKARIASLSNDKANNRDNEENKKPSFKLPLKEGDHRWNIYRVPNFILNGKQDGNVHGGLVIDEKNDNVILVEVTHSSRNGKRNNFEIPNLVSTDLDEDGSLRKSYVRRDLIVSYKSTTGEKPISVVSLKGLINDKNLTVNEKEFILDSLNNLTTAEQRYLKFLSLAEKKDDTE